MSLLSQMPQSSPSPSGIHRVIPAKAGIQFGALGPVSVGLDRAALAPHRVIPAQAGIHSEGHPRPPACRAINVGLAPAVLPAHDVIPAKAGIQFAEPFLNWLPAFAGMTAVDVTIPVKAHSHV